jgi:hypothetical protein
MARKSEFRRKAKACAWLAQRAEDSGVKARYGIVADEWLAMAESPAKFPVDGKRNLAGNQHHAEGTHPVSVHESCCSG